MELEKAKILAEEIQNKIKPYISKIDLSGSITRGHVEVNDLDFVAIPKKGFFTAINKEFKDVSGGDKFIKFSYKGVPVNIWLTAKEQAEATQLHFDTGKGIIQLKRKAKDRGLKLTRYGLYKDKTLLTSKKQPILELLNKDVKFKKFIREGQYPRETDNYYRFRQHDPKEFDYKTFKTLKTPHATKVIGKHKDGTYKVQSIMLKKQSLLKNAGFFFPEKEKKKKEKKKLIEKILFSSRGMSIPTMPKGEVILDTDELEKMQRQAIRYKIRNRVRRNIGANRGAI